ncbi:hypothetical protein CTI12_AA495700 [Artemisia annua]|uniref:Uncharacterized protein n=1 Tax=Artemisia annua TaxID=35608 RepID=A0A2U1LG75_ARTAN|nr:hypothetical protein CTI12_AA495700 [Artemisia annua]
MDYESQERLVKQKYAADMKQLLSEVDSWIQKLSDEMKSHKETLTQLSDLDAQLPRLKEILSAEYKAKKAIIASNKALSSSLGVVLDQLKPFEEDLQTHQAKLDNACSLKKRLSQKVPSTNITKLAETQTDKTILAEQEEINKLKQASKHLTDQASGLQSKLESGNLDLLNQMKKIRMVKDVSIPIN